MLIYEVHLATAGSRDEFDTATTMLSDLNGVTEAERSRLIIASATNIGAYQPQPRPNATGTRAIQ